MLSDLSVFHGIRDGLGLSAQRFIDWATRLPAYDGVIAARQYAEQQRTQQQTVNYTPRQNGAGRDGQQRQIESDAETLRTDPGLGGMIEVQT